MYTRSACSWFFPAPSSLLTAPTFFRIIFWWILLRSKRRPLYVMFIASKMLRTLIKWCAMSHWGHLWHRINAMDSPIGCLGAKQDAFWLCRVIGYRWKAWVAWNVHNLHPKMYSLLVRFDLDQSSIGMFEKPAEATGATVCIIKWKTKKHPEIASSQLFEVTLLGNVHNLESISWIFVDPRNFTAKQPFESWKVWLVQMIFRISIRWFSGAKAVRFFWGVFTTFEICNYSTCLLSCKNSMDGFSIKINGNASPSLSRLLRKASLEMTTSWSLGKENPVAKNKQPFF